MNVLKINTSPIFEIVPRYNLDTTKVLKIDLVKESNQTTQTILTTSVVLLQNENYLIALASSPTGIANDKFSYILSENISGKVVSFGKLMIVDENEIVQDFSKKSVNKFYK